jgi:hypothetical protein
MRALTIAVALALVQAAPALGAPTGAPHILRVSRAADARAHPRARTEQWDLQALDPRTKRYVLIRLRRNGDGLPNVALNMRDRDDLSESLEPDMTFRAGDRRGARFAGEDGTAALAWHGRPFRFRATGPSISGELTLAGRPGPFAAGWNLGQAFRFPERRPERVRVNYDVPVAAGRLTGSLLVHGQALRLNGWRGSLEHAWGSFSWFDRANWADWDAYVVHRRATTWLAFGMNRNDRILGPGARDAQWLGVLAQVGPGETRLCRPRIDRRAWAINVTPDYDPLPHRLFARCHRMRVHFADRLLGSPLRDETYNGFRDQAVVARMRGGGLGTARHYRFGSPFPTP